MNKEMSTALAHARVIHSDKELAEYTGTFLHLTAKPRHTQPKRIKSSC